MKIITSISSAAVIALFPALALANALDTTTGSFVPGGLYSIGALIINLINMVFVPVLFAIAFIVFLYGVAKTYIFSHGESAEVADGHKIILWGLIGFFIMVSVWGLVNVVASTFGLNTAGAPNTPTFTPTPASAGR